MLSQIEEKFRTGAQLSVADKFELENIVLFDPTISSIQSALYIYGREFPFDEKIAVKARKLILEDKIPGLTATAIKVLVDFWGTNGALMEELEKYIDFSLYSQWYDEIIVAVSFFIRHPQLITKDIAQKLATLGAEARISNDSYLCELLGS